MNNPPAFPTNQYANGISPSGFDTGMTLRDYFAAKALDVGIHQIKDFYGIDKVALGNWCYEMADAMLKAREQ